MSSSMYTSTPETTNANRACRVILGPCTDGLRDALRHYVPPSKFNHVIKQKKLNLPRLTAVQRDLILPQHGSYTGSYEDMDISLLYLLLRNITATPPHSKGWGNDPDHGDSSLSASIERIREVRNRCVHSCDPCMSNSDFNSIWSTIRSAMVDLDAFLINGNKYEKEVDFLRHESMDPERDVQYEELRKQVEEDEKTREMVVILERRMDETSEKVETLDDKVKKLAESPIPSNVRGIKTGDYSIIYMSPETLLSESWRDMIINSQIYRERVCLIAIDEAHILESWGDTFRPTFARLGELRSHFSAVPYLMLTATCTQEVLQHITAKIHLPHLKLFSASPDRPEIYLEYKRSKEIFEDLDWLFNEIKSRGIQTRKTLIYVRSLSRAGNLYRDVLGHLRGHAYLGQRRGFHNSHVALYHAGMTNKDLDYILHTFSKPDSVIRLVICTIAFGMGINIPDIELIIHWGACDSIMDYWQEVGRAGRDGRRAKALYYVTPGSLLQASDEMKKLCRLVDKCEVKCFRDSILQHFIGYSSPQAVPECQLKCEQCDCLRCRCCHLCSRTCPCHNNSQ